MTISGYHLTCIVIVLGAAAFAANQRNEAAPAFPPQCEAIDGDTLRCGTERIRLNGIDTPERGEPGFEIATASLQAALDAGPIRIERLGRDRYGRTIAQVHAGTVDLSCWQLGMEVTSYIERWDEQHRTREGCGNGQD